MITNDGVYTFDLEVTFDNPSPTSVRLLIVNDNSGIIISHISLNPNAISTAVNNRTSVSLHGTARILGATTSQGISANCENISGTGNVTLRDKVFKCHLIRTI